MSVRYFLPFSASFARCDCGFVAAFLPFFGRFSAFFGPHRPAGWGSGWGWGFWFRLSAAVPAGRFGSRLVACCGRVCREAEPSGTRSTRVRVACVPRGGAERHSFPGRPGGVLWSCVPRGGAERHSFRARPGGVCAARRSRAAHVPGASEGRAVVEGAARRSRAAPTIGTSITRASHEHHTGNHIKLTTVIKTLSVF